MLLLHVLFDCCNKYTTTTPGYTSTHIISLFAGTWHNFLCLPQLLMVNKVEEYSYHS